MIFDWYKIFNLDDFLETGLISKTYTVDLEGIGEAEFLATNSILTGVTHNGIFLALMLDGNNPFIFENNAIYFDENNDVYWGFAIT